jgi:hypothetical protein
MRFTIRDVLWLTVVVGLAIGWGLDSRIRSHLSAEYEAHEGKLRETNIILGIENDKQRQRIEQLEKGMRLLILESEP